MQRLEAAFDDARPQRYPDADRLGEAFKVSGAKVLSLEEIAEKAPRSFGNDHCVRLGNLLQTRRKIWCLADDAAFLSIARFNQIADNGQPSGDANTGLQRNRCLECDHRSDHLQPRAHCSIGIILMGLGVAKVDKHAVAEIPRHEPPETSHGFSDAFLIGRDELSQVFRIHLSGECGRTNEVREHHRDLPALASVRRSRYGRWRSPMATAGVIVSRSFRLAIARNSFRRCPTEATPIFSRSWSVRSLRISKSISFSAKR